MASASVGVRLDAAQLRAQITGPNGAVARDLQIRANRVLNKARYLCPVDTGNLRGSLTVEIQVVGQGLVARVGTNVPYAIYVHEGARGRMPVRFLAEALDAAK
jgi:hypothetical protein